MEYRVRKCSLRGYKAYVDWEIGGTRKRKYFSSAKKAKAWADAKNIEVKNSGVNAFTMPEALRVEALEAQVLLKPYGKSITDAVRFAIEHWQASLHSRTVREVADAVIKDRELRAKRGLRGGSERYIRDLRDRYKEFCATFGDTMISSITRQQVLNWLDKEPSTHSIRLMHHRLLSVMWEYATQREWCAENIVKKIKSEEPLVGKISVLTSDDAAKLLYHAPQRFRPTLAVWLFCGLRRSEIERLIPADINLESGLVAVSVTKTKGAAKRYVKIRKNLRAWLLGCGPITPLTAQQFRKDFEEAAEAARVEIPKNAIRHSFCSHALAHERHLNDLVLEMGHTKPDTLFAHYRELVAPQDAAAYWRLTPARAIVVGKDLVQNNVS